MSYLPLTSPVMLAQIVRLNDMWPRWDTDDEQFKRLVVSYKESLDDLDAEAVAGGVSIWLRTSTQNRWPSAAQVRECAGTWIRANRGEGIRRAFAEGCAVCGALPRWADLSADDYSIPEGTPRKRVISRMIAPCHEDKHPENGWMVPYPTNFVRWTPEVSDAPQEQ